MKKINVKIKGLTPLLMHRVIPEELIRKSAMRVLEIKDLDKYAELHAYWKTDPKTSIALKGKKKELCIPSRCLYASMIKAAASYRVKKRALSTILCGIIRISPEEIGLGTAKYETDVRDVVIQRARVLAGRAKVSNWEAKFTLEYNDTVMPDGFSLLKPVVQDAGLLIGLMDYRPSKKGTFGTFKVIEWTE